MGKKHNNTYLLCVCPLVAKNYPFSFKQKRGNWTEGVNKKFKSEEIMCKDE